MHIEIIIWFAVAIETTFKYESVKRKTEITVIAILRVR
jgi:hypothetical protein